MRWELAEALLDQPTEATDQILQLALWYAVEPLPEVDLRKGTNLLKHAKVPLIREHLARRIGSLPAQDRGVEALVDVLAKASDSDLQRDILSGLQHSLKGRRSYPMPKPWDEAYSKLAASTSAEVRERSVTLAVLFGDERALQSLRALVLDDKGAAPARRAALQTLVV